MTDFHPEDLFEIVANPENTAWTVKYKFFLINPSTMEKSRRITEFVMRDFTEKINKYIVDRSNYHSQDMKSRIAQELYMTITDMIHRGIFHRVGDSGFIVDKAWLFASMLHGRPASNYMTDHSPLMETLTFVKPMTIYSGENE